MNARVFRIGHVAHEAGVSPDTLRHYERIGLLSKVGRTSAGYRLYSESTVERVHFIRNALRFGFSLRQLAEFLRARESGRAPCREVRAAGQEILTRVDRQIQELRAARRALQQTLAQWDRRLSRAHPGEPARLLHALAPNGIKSGCLAAPLRRGRTSA